MTVLNRKMKAAQAVEMFAGELAVYDGVAGVLIKNHNAAVNGYAGAIEYRKEGLPYTYFRAFMPDAEITVIHLVWGG